jgi:hypothetical protein
MPAVESWQVSSPATPDFQGEHIRQTQLFAGAHEITTSRHRMSGLAMACRFKPPFRIPHSAFPIPHSPFRNLSGGCAA